jgi:hypothetical protein
LGTYYSVKDAQVGDPVDKANIVRARPGGKARIIFQNGDQFYVAPATSFVVDWAKDIQNSDEAEPELVLDYGKARFVIEKGGPRSRFKIRTKAAVLGVRGTDFFVAVNSMTGATETSTLRGKVEVQPENTQASARPEMVKSGQTGSVTQGGPVEIHSVTRDELKAVARNSEVPIAPQADVSPETLAKVKTLEERAALTTLHDIHMDDPRLGAKLESSRSSNVLAMNGAVIAQLEKTASNEKHAGPITDQALEKGEESQTAPQNVAETEEEVRILPEHRIWIGIRVAHAMSSASVGGAKTTDLSSLGNCGGTGQPACVTSVTSDSSIDSGQLALQAEFGLPKDFSILAEFLPFVQDGTEGFFGQFFCGTNCDGQRGPYGRIEMNSVRLNGIAKWSDSIFGGQRFGIDLELGPGLNFLTSAKFPYSNDQSITSSFGTVSLLLTGGFGIHERIGDRFRVSLDFRFTRGLTNMASSSGIFVNGTTYKLHEESQGLSLSYGL